MIYLDYAANTPADRRVLEEYLRLETALIGNANSHHQAGRTALAQMDQAVHQVADVLSAKPGEVIFTSGASESNNLALKGLTRMMRHTVRHIISTALEHSSVSGCLTALQEQGYEIDLVDIRRDGTVDLEHLRELLRQDTVMVVVSAVDSELGTIQPVDKIVKILKGYPNCHLHVDATQAIGKIPFSFSGIDTMSFTAHKFYGLNGVGVLLKREGLAIEPLIHGGASTTIYRSGTPAVALASSLAYALSMAQEEMTARTEVVRQWNQMLRRELEQYPDVVINSPETAVPHILNLSVRGIRGAAFQKALDEQGVCVSVKSACSSDGLPSRAVMAVSRDRRTAMSSWRISLSHRTTGEEIQRFLSIFDSCYTALHSVN